MPTREAQLEYQRQWMANRRAAYFEDKSCVRCGSVEELRLDHIDPKEKVSHRIWSWKKERREAELAKCQVLCEPCHKEKTREDLLAAAENRCGTLAKYKGPYKCRCVACRQANRMYEHDRRLRHGDLSGETLTLAKSGEGFDFP